MNDYSDSLKEGLLMKNQLS